MVHLFDCHTEYSHQHMLEPPPDGQDIVICSLKNRRARTDVVVQQGCSAIHDFAEHTFRGGSSCDRALALEASSMA